MFCFHNARFRWFINSSQADMNFSEDSTNDLLLTEAGAFKGRFFLGGSVLGQKFVGRTGKHKQMPVLEGSCHLLGRGCTQKMAQTHFDHAQKHLLYLVISLEHEGFLQRSYVLFE